MVNPTDRQLSWKKVHSARQGYSHFAKRNDKIPIAIYQGQSNQAQV